MKTFRCVALDDPSVIEILRSDVSGDLSAYKTVLIGDRSFAINPPSDEYLRRLAARRGIVPAVSDEDELTPAEREYAEATEYAQSAASQLDPALLEQWADEDSAEEAEDALQQRQREAWQSARDVLRFGATLCRAGYRRHAAALGAIARDGWEAIEDVAAVEQLLAQAEGALLESGATAPGASYR
jgi:hypothetical protein